jgi:PTH1 family peptidyl-tRNA hydrolase
VIEQCLVAGLGNPGSRYDGTRHNLGFRVVEELCTRSRVTMHQVPGPALAGRMAAGATAMHLLAPLTYMNNSGTAVALAVSRAGVSTDRVLLVVDDVALPLGAIRIRPGGSDGGHNGLASVIEALGTTDVPRLRMGIAGTPPPAGEDLVEFVLSRFTQEEEQHVRAMVARAADACQLFAERGLADAMNMFNTAAPSTGPFASES